MRRLLTTAAAVILLTVAAACGSTADETPIAGASATTAAPDPTAATAKVCAEAVLLSEQRAAAFTAILKQFIADVLAEKDVNEEAVEAEFWGNLKTWSDRLTELANQPIEPAVRTVLTETAALVVKVNDPNNETPSGEIQKQLDAVTAKIRAACA